MKNTRTLPWPNLILAAGLLSLVIVGVGIMGYPSWHELGRRHKQVAVLTNAATMQLAAESYAASHQGQYAKSAVDLLPYLPTDSAPVNPYTADNIIFQGAVGDLTYRATDEGRNYVIEAYTAGRGKEPQLARTLVGKSSQ